MRLDSLGSRGISPRRYLTVGVVAILTTACGAGSSETLGSANGVSSNAVRCASGGQVAGDAAPLPGHAPSRTPRDALGLFLAVNAAALSSSRAANDAQPSPGFSTAGAGGAAPGEFSLAGSFPLPVSGWVAARSSAKLVMFVHVSGEVADYRIAVGPTGDPAGWSVFDVGRC